MKCRKQGTFNISPWISWHVIVFLRVGSSKCWRRILLTPISLTWPTKATTNSSRETSSISFQGHCPHPTSSPPSRAPSPYDRGGHDSTNHVFHVNQSTGLETGNATTPDTLTQRTCKPRPRGIHTLKAMAKVQYIYSNSRLGIAFYTMNFPCALAMKIHQNFSRSLFPSVSYSTCHKIAMLRSPLKCIARSSTYPSGLCEPIFRKRTSEWSYIMFDALQCNQTHQGQLNSQQDPLHLTAQE